MSSKTDPGRPTGASIVDSDITTRTRTIAECVKDTGHLRNQTNIIESDLHWYPQYLYNLALKHARTGNALTVLSANVALCHTCLSGNTIQQLLVSKHLPASYSHTSLDQLHRTTGNELAKKPLNSLLEVLNSLGFSWQDIARISGVSVPALRKWRHGHSATGANRQRVAMVVAFCRIAEETYLIEDVAGWLETPLHPSAPITGLDLMAEQRFDLALELADTWMQDPESVLDRFEPGWKEKYASQVEVFVAPDGLPGLRLT